MRNMIALALAAILATSALAQFNEQADEWAEQSRATETVDVFGGVIKSQAEMKPFAIVRFDDLGSRPNMGRDVAEVLRLGLHATVLVNAWNIGADDSLETVKMIQADRKSVV